MSLVLLFPSVIHPGTIFQMTNPMIISIIADTIIVNFYLLLYLAYNNDYTDFRN